MKRFLIYLFPAMMDMVVGSAFFVGPVRMAKSGASGTAVTSVITVWAVTYMVVCQLVGRLVTPRNAAWMLVGSSLSLTGCAGAFILIPQVEALYVLMALMGAATAFFFAPFQIFMKAVEQNRPQGLTRSIALYTFSWSTGMACGPFVAGYVLEMAGWQWCHAINAVLAVATAVGVLCLRHYAHDHSAAPAQTAEAEDPSRAPADAGSGRSEPAGEYASMPDLAWLGWVCAGVGCMIVMMVKPVVPLTGRELGIPEREQGTVLALLSVAQAIVGLCLVRSRTWMYRALPVGIFGLFGLSGMLLFGSADQVVTLYVGAICFGIYSGSFYFYFVFHSLVHPSRSERYIGANESLVGMVGILGPLAGGLLADYVSTSSTYLFAAALVGAAVLLQVVVHCRHADAVRWHLRPPEGSSVL